MVRVTHPYLAARLEQIQSRLLDVGSAVATPLDKSSVGGCIAVESS
jgi:hypothetical protein